MPLMLADPAWDQHVLGTDMDSCGGNMQNGSRLGTGCGISDSNMIFSVKTKNCSSLGDLKG